MPHLSGGHPRERTSGLSRFQQPIRTGAFYLCSPGKTWQVFWPRLLRTEASGATASNDSPSHRGDHNARGRQLKHTGPYSVRHSRSLASRPRRVQEKLRSLPHPPIGKLQAATSQFLFQERRARAGGEVELRHRRVVPAAKGNTDPPPFLACNAGRLEPQANIANSKDLLQSVIKSRCCSTLSPTLWPGASTQAQGESSDTPLHHHLLHKNNNNSSTSRAATTPRSLSSSARYIGNSNTRQPFLRPLLSSIFISTTQTSADALALAPSKRSYRTIHSCKTSAWTCPSTSVLMAQTIKATAVHSSRYAVVPLMFFLSWFFPRS